MIPDNRTHPLNKIYHRFLKPRGIPVDQLEITAIRLFEADFIILIQENGNIERYTETEKLTNRQHRDELFKIIGALQNDTIY